MADESWTTQAVRDAVRGTLRHPSGLAAVNDILDANDDASDPVWAEDAFVRVVVDKLRGQVSSRPAAEHLDSSLDGIVPVIPPWRDR